MLQWRKFVLLAGNEHLLYSPGIGLYDKVVSNDGKVFNVIVPKVPHQKRILTFNDLGFKNLGKYANRPLSKSLRLVVPPVPRETLQGVEYEYKHGLKYVKYVL